MQYLGRGLDGVDFVATKVTDSTTTNDHGANINGARPVKNRYAVKVQTFARVTHDHAVSTKVTKGAYDANNRH